MASFKLVSPFTPKGDQPKAIEQLSEGVRRGDRYQTLLGVTGSGKTFTMAGVIAEIQKPTLVISHNKTLAAQLCQEFRDFFPENAVEYFVSYYDYYQPEAYIAHTDLYIEKDASINEKIDRLRHSATRSVLERKDVIVVASVSCIYGLGTPEDYREGAVALRVGEEYPRDKLLLDLVAVKYERNDIDFARGRFRVRGDTLEVYPAYEETGLRIELSGDEVVKLTETDPLTGAAIKESSSAWIYPATHYVTFRDRLDAALAAIEAELSERVGWFKERGRLLEAQRLDQRTRFDLEMIRETGYCHGIENYSRHLSARAPGDPPATLLDYFPEDFLVFIDESHVTIPQLRSMHQGDRARKDSLVEYGFRLPSAYDNRPLRFDEFIKRAPQMVFVSATPAPFELKLSSQVVEQIIRPTGLIDPEVVVRSSKGQMEDLKKEIDRRTKSGERVLVTTLTKRMAEDLAEYLLDEGIKVRYLHSDIVTLDRIDILRGLRLGEFDVLVGVNLLREGLDLPEVSLVAILDADKEGFLRAETSLIQTIGRAARNINGQVILYADKVTGSMHRALTETGRRRERQLKFNRQNNIVPQTIVKAVKDIKDGMRDAAPKDFNRLKEFLPKDEAPALIRSLTNEMRAAAIELDFERAAALRDKIEELRVAFDLPVEVVTPYGVKGGRKNR